MIPIRNVAKRMSLSPAAMAALPATGSPRVAIVELLRRNLADDALKLYAHLLRPAYAVAWVCECARRQRLDALDEQGLALAEAWLRDPVESRRHDAMSFAVTERCANIGAWLAATAAWAGDPATGMQAAHAVVAAITRLAAIAPEGFAPAREASMRGALGLLDTFETSP